MAENIYSVSPENIIGGPGRLIAKAWDGSYPTTIEEVMDINNPSELQGGFFDLGATVEGIVISRSFETEDFSVDQLSSPVDSDITGWTHAVTTTLAENTPRNRQLALIGGPIIETAPVLGASTTTVTDSVVGATLLNLTSTEGFNVGGYVNVGGQTYRINAVTGSSISLDRPVESLVATGTTVAPVIEMGTRRIGYGTPAVIPIFTLALISRKKDNTLYMAVFRRCKVSGDEKAQTFSSAKRTLPFAMNAFPDNAFDDTENVYFEIEQMA